MENVVRIGQIYSSRILGLIFQLGAALYVARAVGGEPLGIFFICFSSVFVISTCFEMGLVRYVVATAGPECLAGRVLNGGAIVKAALSASLRLSVPFAGLFVAGAVAGQGLGFLASHTAGAIASIGISSAAYACTRIYAAALKSSGYIATSLIIERALLPFGLMISIFLGYSVLGVDGTTVVIWSFVAATSFAAGTALLIWRYKGRRVKAPAWAIDWSAARWMFALELTQVAVARSPVLVVPFVASLDEVGLFGVCFNLASIAGSILEALNSYFGRQFAAARRQSGELLRELQFKMQKAGLLLYAPFFLAYLLAGGEILSVFGKSFPTGYYMLLMLAVGRLFPIALAQPQFFLSMIGKEKSAFAISVVSYVGFVFQAAAFGSLFGAFGVAFALLLTLAVESVWGFAKASAVCVAKQVATT